MIVHGLLLIDPRLPAAEGWLRTEGDRIVEVGEGPPSERADLGGADRIVSAGFIDAHVHLPQLDAVGVDGLELLAWLERVIYPAEAAWGDPGLAETAALEAHRRLLRAGTLGYAGYLTAHEHAVAALRRAAERVPLRAVAGQVLMDRAAPPELISHEPVPLTRSTDGRLETSINPRFAVACSDSLLARAGGLARDGAPIQTHLAESRAECDRVRRLFRDDPSYTAVYDRHGLLTPRTLVAHGVHLAPAEWRLLAERGTVVVHCPLANTFLRSGVFDLRAAPEHGVRVAVGSDVAAGTELAMPRVARAVIETAKLRSLTVDPNALVPTPAQAWSMITRDNADALGWSDAGRIEIGAAADLLVLTVPFEPDEHLVARLLYTWREAYIESTILAGRVVAEG